MTGVMLVLFNPFLQIKQPIPNIAKPLNATAGNTTVTIFSGLLKKPILTCIELLVDAVIETEPNTPEIAVAEGEFKAVLVEQFGNLEDCITDVVCCSSSEVAINFGVLLFVKNNGAFECDMKTDIIDGFDVSNCVDHDVILVVEVCLGVVNAADSFVLVFTDVDLDVIADVDIVVVGSDVGIVRTNLSSALKL